MRQGPRDVFLNDIQFVEADHAWMWNSKATQFQGYVVWYVFSGTLVAESLQFRWEIPQSHLFLLPYNSDPTSLTVLGDQETSLTRFNYQESSGARLPAQCRRIDDSSYMEILIHKANRKILQRHVWEANTILQAVLDEVFLGEAVIPHNKETFDSEMAHRLTQRTLKTIDWGHTQRLLSAPSSSAK